MIKKSLFEDELIHGMQRELHGYEKKQGMASLAQAAEYLHSAAQIFEEAGLTAKADQILQILSKIAATHDTKVKMMPSLQALMENGVTNEDLKGVGRGDAFSKARVNTAFRRLGYTDKEIVHLLGKHNLMSEEEAAELMNPKGAPQRFMSWIKDPTAPIDPENPTPSEKFQQNVTQWMKDPGPPEQFEMQSALPPKQLPEGEDLVFKSIAQELGLEDDNDAKGKPRKPKDPTKIHDPHIPSIKQEVQNYKTHGWAFNMADDGNADTNNVDIPQPKGFDEFYEKWKARHMKEEPMEEVPPTVRETPMRPPKPDFGDLEGLIVMDDEKSDDMLEADINEKPLAVHEDSLGKTFEDSD